MSESDTLDTTDQTNGAPGPDQDAPESAEDILDPVDSNEPGAADDEGYRDRRDDSAPERPGQTDEPDDRTPRQTDRQPHEGHEAGAITTESIIEAVLFATDTPLPPARIAQIIGVGGVAEVKKHIAALNEKYSESGASFRIDEIAKGYQMLTLPEYNVWLRKLFKVRRESKLSQAALETLAVVAYKQPVMRVVIEEIRGVAVGEILQRLREMNLVKIVGRAEVLGRPLLYGTTKHFLEVFGLASLGDLPKVEELTPPDKQEAHQPSEQPAAPDDAESGDSDQEEDTNAAADAAGESGPDLTDEQHQAP